ncbi:enterobactin/ferric enterobactin esterase [Roseivivax jejudonensis]|uniref:Enterobactin/ferric enterobactin esterase n=1 Tax=Roseivivax jejudonensis TaxID=1529041 RepID=A0A1X6Z4Q7_9RHOB|nr:alpha/beta hydrolase-fold protein [Roseivivax jejudonensis]SLN40418.1 enterobactin/ferric enterobactin esterase [Roseivivax jejudonensis]
MPRSVLRLAAILLPLVALFAGAARAACGPDTSAPCEIAGGSYHVELPEAPQPGAPALMFIHGWGSSGEGTLTMRGVVETALERGYAVIAPDGIPREGRSGRTWAFHPERPQRRDEVAFLQAVRDNAAARFDLDPDAMLLAGFSIGGSMASYLACAAPEAFAAYAPVSGSFWRPHPEGCAGPVRLLHTHGWRDGTVPLEGRLLRGEALEAPDALAQGDVWHAMALWRSAGGCRLQADGTSGDGTYWRKDWTSCAPGATLSFALFDGGHGVPPGWADMALDWFEDQRS